MRSRFFLSLFVAGIVPLQSILLFPSFAAAAGANSQVPDGWTDDDAGADGPGTILQFPGMPALQVMPDGRIRPRGPQAAQPQGMPQQHRKAALKPSLSPEEQAKAAKLEALKRAMAPQKTHAEIRGEMLDALFKHLGNATDAQEAESIATAIERVWLQSDSATANLLMERGLAAMEAQHLPLALTVFDKLLLLEPSWAEAWEKRATTRLLGGDLDGAMADMRQVLKLEPRQFSALAALGLVLHRQGFDKEALTTLRKSLALDPQQPQIKELVDKISVEVEGRDI
ncbi:MAG: tetratricopeptide repeat protein [Methylovirgula sp.]